MKKIVIVAVVIVIIISLVLIKSQSNIDINKILEKYESYETDGYGNNSGYIVSNKTSQGYRYGYLNYKGKLLLKVEYNKIYRILDIGDKDDVYLIASKEGRYGVSKNGKTFINYEYQFIEYKDTNEIFILNKSNKYGIANLDGKIIIDINNDDIKVKGDNIYIKNGEEEYVCDQNGNRKDIDFNTTITKAGDTNYYIKTTYENEKYKYNLTNEYGENIINQDYEYLEYISNNYFIASDDKNMQGIIDTMR